MATTVNIDHPLLAELGEKARRARDLKNELRKRMTREQIAEAQQLSIEWEQSVSSQ